MRPALPTRHRVLLLAGLAVAASGVALTFWLSQPGGGVEHQIRTTTTSKLARAETPVREKLILGTSVRGRPIPALLLGDPDAARPLLVVGAIHGDEPAGIAVARDLAGDPPPRSGLIVTIPDLNPDGVAAGTRQNARGVDLNRNFPWRWRHLDHLGDPEYSGPHPCRSPNPGSPIR